MIWVTNNTTTTYNEYPHSDDGFVKWAEWDTRYPDEWIARTTGVKDHWYSFEFQPQYLQDIGWGGGVTLRGHFWRFIGPYLEAWSLTDGTDFQGGARFGLLLALFQSEGFNLSVYGQGNFWFGAVERGGGTVGLELRSYPFRPVTLMGRAGFQLFSAFNIGEAEAQLGLMLGATEVFAGWRYWHLQTTGGSPVAAYSGPFGGLRWYF